MTLLLNFAKVESAAMLGNPAFPTTRANNGSRQSTSISGLLYLCIPVRSLKLLLAGHIYQNLRRIQTRPAHNRCRRSW